MGSQQRTELNAVLRNRSRGRALVTVEQMRQHFAAFMATFTIPIGVRETAISVGGLPAIRIEPEASGRNGSILYFHGGSFVVGSPRSAMVLTANLALRAGVSVTSLDYRLAPEHPFPAAINDGVAAYRGLIDAGIAPTSIAFAGDSTGGGLAVSTALAAKDAGLEMPAAIAALSPSFDLTYSGDSMRTRKHADPTSWAHKVAYGSDWYLAGQTPSQPLASPAVLADLRGFPPMLLQTGTNDLLLDDSVRLAERARGVGVDVTLDVTADVPHVFQAWAETLDEADRALDRAALFLSQHLRQDEAPQSLQEFLDELSVRGD